MEETLTLNREGWVDSAVSTGSGEPTELKSFRGYNPIQYFSIPYFLARAPDLA